MKKFRVVVNGNEYEVGIEEIKGESGSMPTPKVAPAVAPAPAKKVAAPAPIPVIKAAPVSAGSETVTAPIPGVILTMCVKVGDKVAKGSTLLVLEAMKMENEIMAPIDGVVSEIRAQQGTSVNAGDILVVVS